MAKVSSCVKVTRKSILKSEIPMEDTGRTPLHLEASGGFSRAVKELLDDGADVNARDKDGRTPLHWPCYRGHLEIVQMLFESGADINAEDEGGRTPLRMAIIGNHRDTICFIRDHGGRT